jgi:hypothetical protein
MHRLEKVSEVLMDPSAYPQWVVGANSCEGSTASGRAMAPDSCPQCGFRYDDFVAS